MIRILLIWLLSWGAGFTLAEAGTAAPDSLAQSSVFHSEMARVEIQKPATWHFAKVDSVTSESPLARLNDEAFLAVVKKMANRPLVAATKHDESFAGLNPSFQLIVRPAANLEGKSGVELLQFYIPRLSQAFSAFKVIKEPYPISVGGHPGGRLDMSYTITTADGKSLPGMSTLVLVPNSKVVYQVGFSYPPEGPDKLTNEIDQVLGSVKWLE